MRVKRVIFNTLTISAISFGVIYVANILLTNYNAFASNTGVGMHASIGSAYTMEISSNNVALEIVPSVEGTFKSDYTTVSTYTNTNDTCTVVMTTSSTDLASGDNVIPTLEESAPEATFANDHWGFRVGSTGDFNTISEENTIVTYNEATGNDGNNTSVYFAAKLTPETKAGTYTNTVTFAATCASSGGGDPKVYMQNITEATLASLMPNVGDSTTLYDSRDEKAYTVAYLADGNYWMTQNLDHDIDTIFNYNSTNTDIPSSWTPVRATYPTAVSGTSAWCVGGTWNSQDGYCESNYTPESYDPGNLYWNGTESDYSDWGSYYDSCDHTSNTPVCNETLNPIATYTTNAGTPTTQYHIGNYYNWNAAVAMNDTSSLTTYGQIVDQSICPAGWTLPRVVDDNNTFYALWNEYGFSSSSINGSDKLWQSPLYTVASGSWDGILNAVGYGGAFWSPVTYESYNSHDAFFTVDGGVSTFSDDVRYVGYSVRCIARKLSEAVDDISDLEYMQDFATLTSSEKADVLSSMTTGQQYQLMDNRDNKSYYISKLADGNVWMTQNLDHDIVTTADFYTYANTDIGHGSTPNTSATWTASNATYATNDDSWEESFYEPESYDPGNICWNGTIASDWSGTLSTYAEACGNDKHYHIGNYYNWTAAVATNDSSSYTTDQQDVDQSICPAGWRLPTYSGNKSYNNLVTQLSLTSRTSGNAHNTPVYFVYGGSWYGESSSVGGMGGYWSSIAGGNDYAYELFISYAGDMDPQNLATRGNGAISVRCVAR